mgnify:CR=1 FL=1
MDLEEVGFTGDEENVGGINHTEVYLIDRKHLDTIETPPGLDDDPAPADFDTLMKIGTAHTPATGKGFIKIEVISKTGNVESTLAGEDGGKGYNNAFSFQVKGNSTKALGLLRWATNREIIALVKEIGGQIRQIGGSEIPAMLSEATSTLGGGTHEGKKHVAFTVADYQAYPAPVYDTDIPVPA